MNKQEIIERLSELMQERENLSREHQDLLVRDKLLTEQLEIVVKEMQKGDF